MVSVKIQKKGMLMSQFLNVDHFCGVPPLRNLWCSKKAEICETAYINTVCYRESVTHEIENRNQISRNLDQCLSIKVETEPRKGVTTPERGLRLESTLRSWLVSLS